MNTTTQRSFFGVLLMVLGAAALTGCAADVSNEDEGVNEDEVRGCSTRRSPMCGVNGVTYSNACRAGSHRIAYQGACVAECRGIVCGVGETCDPGASCPVMTGEERHACDPIPPHCVPVEAPNPCASTTCLTGSTCVVENGRAVCLDQCASVRCPGGTTCRVIGNAVSCQPNAQCTVDSDCHLEDNYCGGCACESLPSGAHSVTCTNPVMCFRQPCGGLTAACDAGTCVAR